MPMTSDPRALREKLAWALARWKLDPVAYVMEAVGETPTAQQVRLLRAVPAKKFVAVRSGHGVGKSRALAWLVHWYLDTHRKPGEMCRVPITGAGSSGLTDVLWGEVSGVHAKKLPWLRDRWVVQSDRMFNVESPRDWFAVLRTARRENPDALQGFHRCFYVIDEGSGVPDEVFEVAQGAMGDEGSMGVMTGNPTRLNGYFWRVFNRKTMWYPLHFPSSGSLNTVVYRWPFQDALGRTRIVESRGLQSPSWVEAMKEEHGERSSVYRVRVLGEFGNVDGDYAIPPSLVEDVFGRGRCDPVPPKDGKVVAALDVGRGGADACAFVACAEDRVITATDWKSDDTVAIAAKAKALMSECGAIVLFVDTVGVGAGVFDVLRHSGVKGVREFTANALAPADADADCRTMRDWVWWRARTWLRKRPVRFAGTREDDAWNRLGLELCTPELAFDTQGRVVVESKDRIRERGGKSPNLGDALVMAMAAFDHKLFPWGPRGMAIRTEDSPAARRRRKMVSSKRTWAVV